MKDNLRFYSILDFYPNRIQIKKEFNKLNIQDMLRYKKEVYSICFEREYVKDLIWEYLNNWDESYEKLEKEYWRKKNK